MTELAIKYDFSLLESIEFQLQLFIPKITRRQSSMLAYMIVYPDTYKEKMLEDNISISVDSINVRLSQMAASGILKNTDVKDSKNKNKELVDEIKNIIQLGDFVYNITVNLKD